MLFRPTLDRFPAVGLGVLPTSLNSDDPVEVPRGVGEPKEDLRAPFNPFATAFCRNGLPAGEYGDPPSAGLPLPDSGELA